MMILISDGCSQWEQPQGSELGEITRKISSAELR